MLSWPKRPSRRRRDKSEGKKKKKRSITRSGTDAGGSRYYWATDAILSRYASQGVSGSLLLLFSTSNVALARAFSFLLLSFPLSLAFARLHSPSRLPSLRLRFPPLNPPFLSRCAVQAELFHELSRFDVNDACWISQRRAMMKPRRLITLQRAAEFSSTASGSSLVSTVLVDRLENSRHLRPIEHRRSFAARTDNSRCTVESLGIGEGATIYGGTITRRGP